MKSKENISISGRDTEEQILAVQFDGVTNGWLLLGEAFNKMTNKVKNWLKNAGQLGLSRSEINKMNGHRADGIDDALQELQAAKLAESKMIETTSKPQERWYLIEST